MATSLTMRQKRRPVHFTLPEGLRERLDRVAAADKRTVTSLIEQALEAYLPVKERELAGISATVAR